MRIPQWSSGPARDHSPPGGPSPVLIQRLQEAGHGANHNYQTTSPHLKHSRLRDRLVGLLLDEITAIDRAGLPRHVLEVGAGHGGFTEPTLASGCSVTATEMSRPSVDHLRERYSLNPRFVAVFDADGSLSVLGDESFSVILCASVLHHIPDYVSFLEGPVMDRLVAGGSLVTVQDPSWYPEMTSTNFYLSRLAYYSWRLAQGQYLEGFNTRLRRLRCICDERILRDMVEYHVVRSGVNQDAIVELLKPRFESVRLVNYWSAHGAAWQRTGERLGRTNTFAIIARSFRP